MDLDVSGYRKMSNLYANETLLDYLNFSVNMLS
jgi:hypothetical protein